MTVVSRNQSVARRLAEQRGPDYHALAKRLRLVADATRLCIFDLLRDRELNTGAICTELGFTSQPAVSHHLAILRLAGLVMAQRRGQFVFYMLTEQGRDLAGTIQRLTGLA